MPVAKVNRIDLYYELIGTGAPLLLIGGFAANTSIWTSISSSLTEKFQLLQFDNRGAGQSMAPDRATSLEEMASDTVALMQSLGIEKAHILGQSMGGAIAQIVARRYPERVEKLILSNTFTHLSKCAKRVLEHRVKMYEEDVSPRILIPSTLTWLFSNRFLKEGENAKRLIEFMEKNPHPPTKVGFRRQFEALVAFDSRPWLSEIQKETLIIAGEEDVLFPVDEVQELKSQIKSSTLVILKGSSHIPQLEDPTGYLVTVSQFLL